MEHEHKHVTEKKHSSNFFKDPLKVGMALIIILLVAYIAAKSETPQQPPSGGNNQTGMNATSTAKLSIELFVMSQCPYGVQAESSVKKVIDEFKGDVNLSLHFIATDLGNGSFSSLHGANEVAEDLRQVCIMKYYPAKFLDYLTCVNNDYANVGSVWEGCASSSQMDTNTIRQCSTGAEGSGLLRENIKRTQALQIDSSPTIYLNNKSYTGGRDNVTMTRAICGIVTGSDVCKNLPLAVNVKLTIVNDDTCILCDASGIETTLSGMISNLTITTVNYSSDEGKALLQQYNASGLPLYVFSSSIEQDSSYSSLSRYLQKSGSTYMLLVQPVKLLNMVEQSGTLQLFVMSHCPYGTMAEEAVKELTDAVPDLKFGGLYFIATDLGNGTFSSLHGADEVAEDLRQVCIMKYYPSKIMNYTVCIAADYTHSGDIWQNCSSKNGIDAAKIGACSTGNEGNTLLKSNIALSNTLGIYSSPTLLLNNNTLFNSVSAEQMKQVVCAYNPAMSGCNTTLSGTTTAPSGGCG
ncbi:MAG: thioredoxin domain-containing protein [Candidatus Micrarchaeota archaeon]|nr:thioredoxin domain-containing protein [Candidatus Micrarchaeota archaeon]